MSKSTSLEEIPTTSTLLQVLDVRETNRFIAVREQGLADANFILTNLIGQIFAEENNKVCLAIMHNTLGHYQNVGRKLNYDLLKKCQLNEATTIEVMRTIANDIYGQNETNIFLTNRERIIKNLYLAIKGEVGKLLEGNETGQVYLIIDDISHLLDLGVDVRLVLQFINCCAQLITNPRVSIIINCHVCGGADEVVSCALAHIADLNIDVSPLKTGISHAVSGVIKIDRKEIVRPQTKQAVYHYKACDREIKAFAPGETFRHL